MAILLRSNDRKVAGVAAGVAEHFGWKARTVRLAWFVLTFVLAGAPLLFYIVLWMIMPSRSKEKKDYAARMNERLGK